MKQLKSDKTKNYNYKKHNTNIISNFKGRTKMSNGEETERLTDSITIAIAIATENNSFDNMDKNMDGIAIIEEQRSDFKTKLGIANYNHHHQIQN